MEQQQVAACLRETAHKADVQAHNRSVLAVIGKRFSREQKAAIVSYARSAAVTIAVLRELADDEVFLTRDELRGLADCIEKAQED